MIPWFVITQGRSREGGQAYICSKTVLTSRQPQPLLTKHFSFEKWCAKTYHSTTKPVCEDTSLGSIRKGQYKRKLEIYKNIQLMLCIRGKHFMCVCEWSTTNSPNKRGLGKSGNTPGLWRFLWSNERVLWSLLKSLYLFQTTISVVASGEWTGNTWNVINHLSRSQRDECNW